MKILFPDPDKASRSRAVTWLEEERHHAVVNAPGWPENWPAVLAQHEPDLVLLPNGTHLQNMDYVLAKPLFPDCEFRVYDRQGTEDPATYLMPIMEEVERVYRERKVIPRPFADEWRYIVHDPGFLKFAAQGKLHVPQKEEGWEEIATGQEARFILQLQTGMAEARHLRAKKYYRVLRRFNQGMKRECAYRQGHGSYKISWLREQIGRWMTVLAHYVPDVEVENCPPPQNAASRFVFLHHEMPAVFTYPVCCVLIYGIRPTLAEQIKEAIGWRFEGEDDTALAARGYLLFGINEYLAEVARAQIWSMDQFLSPASAFHVGTSKTRALHRTMGIYFEFWGWHYMWNLGPNLSKITLGVHSGETGVKRAEGKAMVPTFRAFRDLSEITPEPPPASATPHHSTGDGQTSHDL